MTKIEKYYKIGNELLEFSKLVYDNKNIMTRNTLYSKYKNIHTKLTVRRINGICKKYNIKMLAEKEYKLNNNSFNTQKYNFSDFRDKSKIIHNNKYIYLNYNGSHKLCEIICPIHGNFKQLAYSHLQGKGCLECSRDRTGFNVYKNQKAVLYYIFLPEYNLYKIGITKSSVESRFKGDIKAGLKIEIIQTKEFQDGYDAYILEQKILKCFKQYKYAGKKVIGSGNTELFTENVLYSTRGFIK